MVAALSNLGSNLTLDLELAIPKLERSSVETSPTTPE
jgi:hypothetical protein